MQHDATTRGTPEGMMKRPSREQIIAKYEADIAHHRARLDVDGLDYGYLMDRIERGRERIADLRSAWATQDRLRADGRWAHA